MNDYDKKVLEASTSLLSEMQQFLPLSLQEIFQKLTPAQLQTLSISLASKIWSRRSQIQSASFYLLSQVLRQSAQRLDGPSNNTGASYKRKTSPTKIPKPIDSGLAPEVVVVRDSPRVVKARQLLKVAQNEEF